MKYRDKNGVLHEYTLIKGESPFESAQIGGYKKSEEQFYKDLGKLATTDNIKDVKDEINGKIDSVKSEFVGVNNVKTINGQSIIGEGDIKIQGGSGDGIDWYARHRAFKIDRFYAFGTYGTIWDMANESDIVYACNSRTSNNFIKVNGTSVTKLSPLPTGKDATDLPSDMAQFYKSGSSWIIRNIAVGKDHIYLSARYSGGADADGTHYYGGIICVNKSTFTVEKSYWTLFLCSRVKLNENGTLMAVGNQMKGITFYAVSGSTLTQKAQFLYPQTSGQPYKGVESQNGTFYTDGNRKFYLNSGFAIGFVLYDVTDIDNIFEVANWKFADNGLSSRHTYSAVVDYPYAYITSTIPSGTSPTADKIGVIALDVSNPNNITIVKETYINEADFVEWNGTGDTKPTEMKRYENALITNYENGFLIFDISTKGNPIYCGKYGDVEMYGLCANELNGKLIVGDSTRTDTAKSGYFNTYMGQ